MASNSRWTSLSYGEWSATCDTLHAHTQVLGKLAATLAPPEPQLLHAALRLTARGWETRPLPAPDGSGSFVVVIDLHSHRELVEHSDGRSTSLDLTPDRSVGEVTGELLAAVSELVGRADIDPTPQEVPWTVPLDQDSEHAAYDPDKIVAYFASATRAWQVLEALRAPYRGRSTPVCAWWGSFDLAVNLFSGASAEPPAQDFITRNSMDSEEVAIGWWPGEPKYPKAAFYGYSHPAPDGFEEADIGPPAARWDPDLGLFLLDWEDVIAAEDPHAEALGFARSLFLHACTACGWDPALAASAEGSPPPVTSATTSRGRQCRPRETVRFPTEPHISRYMPLLPEVTPETICSPQQTASLPSRGPRRLAD
jgi:hypothetical protein